VLLLDCSLCHLWVWWWRGASANSTRSANATRSADDHHEHDHHDDHDVEDPVCDKNAVHGKSDAWSVFRVSMPEL